MLASHPFIHPSIHQHEFSRVFARGGGGGEENELTIRKDTHDPSSLPEGEGLVGIASTPLTLASVFTSPFPSFTSFPPALPLVALLPHPRQGRAVTDEVRCEEEVQWGEGEKGE